MVVSPDGERSEASVVSRAWRASGAAPPNIPECAAWAIVRTVIRTDPVPRNDNARMVMEHFKNLGQPIDLMKVMDEYPQFLVRMLDYLSPQMGIIENLSRSIQDGLEGEIDGFRRALYTCEVLRKFEPSIVSLEIVGDYTTYNINWLVRKLNSLKIDFSLEDPTVEFLMQRYRMFAELANEPIPERFEILSQIFLEQAFPMNDDDYADLMNPD